MLDPHRSMAGWKTSINQHTILPLLWVFERAIGVFIRPIMSEEMSDRQNAFANLAQHHRAQVQLTSNMSNSRCLHCEAR